MGLRMTITEKMQAAQQRGHTLQVRHITEPETDGRWTRGVGMQPCCTCGWADRRSWKSEKAVNASLSWHLGNVIGDLLIEESEARAQSRAAGRPGVPSAP